MREAKTGAGHNGAWLCVCGHYAAQQLWSDSESDVRAHREARELGGPWGRGAALG